MKISSILSTILLSVVVAEHVTQPSQADFNNNVDFDSTLNLEFNKLPVSKDEKEIEVEVKDEGNDSSEKKKNKQNKEKSDSLREKLRIGKNKLEKANSSKKDVNTKQEGRLNHATKTIKKALAEVTPEKLEAFLNGKGELDTPGAENSSARVAISNVVKDIHEKEIKTINFIINSISDATVNKILNNVYSEIAFKIISEYYKGTNIADIFKKHPKFTSYLKVILEHYKEIGDKVADKLFSGYLNDLKVKDKVKYESIISTFDEFQKNIHLFPEGTYNRLFHNN